MQQGVPTFNQSNYCIWDTCGLQIQSLELQYNAMCTGGRAKKWLRASTHTDRMLTSEPSLSTLKSTT